MSSGRGILVTARSRSLTDRGRILVAGEDFEEQDRMMGWHLPTGYDLATGHFPRQNCNRKKIVLLDNTKKTVIWNLSDSCNLLKVKVETMGAAVDVDEYVIRSLMAQSEEWTDGAYAFCMLCT